MELKARTVFRWGIGTALFLAFGFAPVIAQPYNFYYGNIHAHSGYSDGNADSTTSMRHTPAQDYDYALSSAHFDFLGISDHNHSTAGMSLSHFHMGVTQAQNANLPGEFVALYGMEYGVITNGGHMLVYGIDSLVGWQSGNYDIYCGQYNYAQLYGIVNAHAGAFCSLAHPQTNDFSNLGGSSYSSTADIAISGTSIRSGSAFSSTTNYSDGPATLYETYFKTLLSKGYHVGPTIDHDNHNTTFGRTLPGRTVVLANDLTKTEILSGLKSMRYYASDDWNVQVDYTINGLYMGSVADITANPTISVSVSDPDNENTAQISVYYGVPGSNSAPTVLTSNSNSNTLTYTHSINLNATYYYYLKIQQYDGNLIWTAPIWVHKVNVPLPLELESFHATPLKDRVRLDWSGYVRDLPGLMSVERSTDGLHYEELWEISTHPLSGVQYFTYEDLDPVEGLAFYRLHETDADGSETYSPVVAVRWGNPELLRISEGPNPVTTVFTLAFDARKEAQYWYFLYDENGRELRRQAFDTVHGGNKLELDVHALPDGLYYLILGQPGRRLLETKLVKHGN